MIQLIRVSDIFVAIIAIAVLAIESLGRGGQQ